MKAKAIKPYRDKYTGKFHKIGQEIELTKKRFEQINSTAFGIFLEEIPETPEPDKTETKKTTKTK